MDKISPFNLKKFRQETGLNQKQFAEAVDLPIRTYRSYEAGERTFPLPLLEKTADLLGCELCVLFEKDINTLNNVLTCAFRIDNLRQQDMDQIAKFKNIVISYLKMKRIETEHEI